MHENTKTQGQNRQRTFFIQKTQRHKEYRHTHIFLHKNTKTQGQSSHRIFLYIKHKTHKEYKYEQTFLAKNTETHGQNWHRIFFSYKTNMAEVRTQKHNYGGHTRPFCT